MSFMNMLPEHFLNRKNIVNAKPTSTSANASFDATTTVHNDYFTSDIFRMRLRPRLVQKTGELNISMNNVPKHRRRLFRDIFNTILAIKWRWHVVFFLLSFMVSWLVFAIGWYLIAYFHNDLEFNYEQVLKLKTNYNHTHIVCVSGIHDFTTALLYSIETQHTIGYGFRHITEECPFAIMYLMLQSCFGIFVQGLVAGMVFAKISCPNKRKSTIIFSNNAVISKRDDEFVPFKSYEMRVRNTNFETCDSIFFPWPKTIEHIIDNESPLYEVLVANNERTTKTHDYEIVIILEGNIETTGASCHIRTSYMPDEILWGYRFKPIYPLISDSHYLFDYSKFNQVEPTNAFLFHLNRNNNFSTQTTVNIENNILKINNNYKSSETSKTKMMGQSNETSSQKTNGRFTIVPVRQPGMELGRPQDDGYFTHNNSAEMV